VEVGADRKRWSLFSFPRPHTSGVLQDASTDGIRVRVDSEVKVASRMKVWIEAWRGAGWKQVALQGTVMWGRPADDGEHWVAGIQLGGPRRGMQTWRDVITGHLAAHTGTVALG
jgi:hypothetical protein